MSEKETLVRIVIITDDDTGMYQIGEVDGLFSDTQLEYFLNLHGATGLLEHLARLMAKVVEVDKGRRPIVEPCMDANKPPNN